MGIDRIDVGGLPVFLAEAPAPYQAGLIFRVGVVDEPLKLRGISHLCEHLALSSLEPPEHPFNGFVTLNCTHFVMQGTADEAIRYFEGLCRAIRSLPLERLEKERRILQAEEATHRPGLVEIGLLCRLGAAGYGRTFYPELGLQALANQQVEEWAAERFCARAAALWLHGPDPRPVGRRLALDLRPGEAHPIPPIEPIIGPEPVWLTENVAGPNISFLARRSAALVTGFTVFHQRLEREARHERALAYNIGGSYQPLTGDLAHAHMGIDATPEHHRESTDVLLSVLDELIERGPSVEEVEAHRRRYRAEWDNAFSDAADARHMTVETLLGSVETPQTIREAILAVDTEAARQDIVEAFRSSLLMLPKGGEPPAGRFVEVPRWSSTEVDGAFHRHATASTPVATVGPKGLSCKWAEGQSITVQAQRCEALLRWDDGVRLAIGTDGFQLRIAPWEWQDGERLVRWIDATFPADRWVAMGAGEGPPLPDGAATIDGQSSLLGQIALTMGGLLTVGAVFSIGTLVSEPHSPHGDTWQMVRTLCVLASVCWTVWGLDRRRRNSRRSPPGDS